MNELQQTDFGPVTRDPETVDSLLLDVLNSAMELHLPTKQVKLREVDKSYFTSELKQLNRQMKREYAKHQKSHKYFALKEKFQQLHSKAAKDHLKRNVESLLKTKPGRAFSTLKRMGARPGEDIDGAEFQLPEFSGRDLTADQVADEIGNYFAAISQEFRPMELDRLPAEIRDETSTAREDQVPDITPGEVEQVILAVNVHKGKTE